MRKVLITGGAGFIGANFLHHWLKAHPQDRVVMLDALTYAGSTLNFKDAEGKSNFRFVQGDICDEQLVNRLMQDEGIDTVAHFAAESHVDRSIDGPDAFIRTNILGTHVLLKAAKAAWAGKQGDFRFHHVSTDEVFGSLGPNDPAFHEKTPYDPSSPYSASKASSDHLVRAYHRTYGLPVTITNCSNNYGPYQFPEKLIPVIILNALAGRPIPVYGDGQQVRDWLYVADHCTAIERVILKGTLGETYNVGGNGERKNIEIVRTICKLLDERRPDSQHRPHEKLIKFVQDRPGHDRRYAIDIRYIKKELDWQPAEDLASGLAKTVDWYLAHLDWCEAVAGHKTAAERRGLGGDKA
ncbi:MAG TPA: dTDP-glucose 4,6-dehydratase [Gammaproteobacteria bacterium]|jgi:dTDP-glucose 4,6-dehydratase|nr:dTDP-glucose 4,6-dehydratase [Gammaproteobacteria bacterium]